ncbi:MAG: hypothetical protein M1401_03340 [Chloroflexi bacterium]|nr:hypothetical protein [Chloroflexota bacterium]MDA8216154.1 hypothetical protein [Dehalococcoidales bacterium]
MKRNPGKAKRIERRIGNAAKRDGHKRLAAKTREMKATKPRVYYSWRNRRRKQGR